jgi:uncharacterized SAM-binding protein YcdF (DUF218 family)
MYFAASKLLSGLCDPLVAGLILLFLFGLGVRRRLQYGSARLFWLGFLVLYLSATRLVSGMLIRPLEDPYRVRKAPDTVDAIVVLGGSIDLAKSSPEHCEMRSACDRFIDGLLLARKYPRAVLIFSGGTAELGGGDGQREAPLLKDLAVKLGIPADRVIAEDKSRNTRENAVETKRILDERKLTQVVVVTSGYHIRRALGCFRALGVKATPYATDFKTQTGRFGLPDLAPEAESLGDSARALREYLGLQVYKKNGWLAEDGSK